MKREVLRQNPNSRTELPIEATIVQAPSFTSSITLIKSNRVDIVVEVESKSFVRVQSFRLVRGIILVCFDANTQTGCGMNTAVAADILDEALDSASI